MSTVAGAGLLLTVFMLGMCACVFCLVLCSIFVQCVAAYLCVCLSCSIILLSVAFMCGSLIELGLSGVVCVHIVKIVGIAVA